MTESVPMPPNITTRQIKKTEGTVRAVRGQAFENAVHMTGSLAVKTSIAPITMLSTLL